MRFSKSGLLVLQGVSGGAFGLGIIATLIGAFAFSSEEFYHDDKLGMEFAMEVDTPAQITSVWMRVPQGLFIKTTIYNLKVNGAEDEGSLNDLMPISDANSGTGEMTIEILAADDEQMPDLAKHDQSIIPMAYVRETSKFPAIQRCMMILFGAAVKYWFFVKISIYVAAIASIILGFILRQRNKKNREANLVTEIEIK